MITTVITRSSPVGIVLLDSSHILIANITMNECASYFTLYRTKYSYETEFLTSLLIADSNNITFSYFLSLSQHKRCGITLINVFGYLSDTILSQGMITW